MKLFQSILLASLLISCIQAGKNGQSISNDELLNKLFENFQDNMGDGDSLVFRFNLAMESYVRDDSLFLSKAGNHIEVKSIVNEKNLELDKEFLNYKTEEEKYSLNPKDSLSLESFIKRNLYRKDKKDSQVSTVEIFGAVDTLKLYTYNLSDKSQFINQYFNVMAKIFPDEQYFKNGENTFPVISKFHTQSKN